MIAPESPRGSPGNLDVWEKGMADEKIKVLFDTDIGSDIDDALALAYLLGQKRCELLGVTTVTGEPLRRAEMVSAICRNVGRDDVPVHAGCEQALLIEMRQKTAPQAAALGTWDRRRDFPPNSAVGFLREAIRAHPGEVTLLTVGPLTNAGLLFAIDPEVPSLLRQMVLMCGRFFGAMGGEWNAIGDPHATAVVYGQGFQTRPPQHVSFGLDVTTRCVMDADQCRRRFTAPALAPVREFAEVWFRRARQITFHDPLAAACIFQPDLCQYRQGRVTVSLAEPTMGWTVFAERDEKPHAVACEVDPERFFEHYFGVVR
jgi:inosine-uridine nucleoside N-ribohydrolase